MQNSLEYSGKLVKISTYQKDDKELFNKFFSENKNHKVLVSDMLIHCMTGTSEEAHHSLCINNSIFLMHSSDGDFLGVIILQNINYNDETSELLILFDKDTNITEDLFFETAKKILMHCFLDMGLARVETTILEINLKLKQLYKQLGFQEEGLLRDRFTVNNKTIDAFILSMLKVEWARMEK